MSVKIQINSLEALERLIGGDSELEIELRGSVVSAFAHRHLKTLINDRLIAAARAEVTRTLDASIADTIRQELEKRAVITNDRSSGYKPRVTLTAEVRTAIARGVDDAINQTITDTIKTYVGENGELITNVIKQYFNQELKSKIKSGVDQRLAQIAAQIDK